MPGLGRECCDLGYSRAALTAPDAGSISERQGAGFVVDVAFVFRACLGRAEAGGWSETACRAETLVQLIAVARGTPTQPRDAASEGKARKSHAHQRRGEKESSDGWR
jgi:hypothetical protein